MRILLVIIFTSLALAAATAVASDEALYAYQVQHAADACARAAALAKLADAYARSGNPTAAKQIVAFIPAAIKQCDELMAAERARIAEMQRQQALRDIQEAAYKGAYDGAGSR